VQLSLSPNKDRRDRCAPGAGRGALHEAEQQCRGFFCDERGAQIDVRQVGGHGADKGGAIETDDRQILDFFPGGKKAGKGAHVVVADYAGSGVQAGQEMGGAVDSRLEIPAFSIVIKQRGFGYAPPPAGFQQKFGARFGEAGCAGVGRRKIGDALVSCREQMIHGQGDALLDVDGDRGFACGAAAEKYTGAGGFDGEVAGVAFAHFGPDEQPVHGAFHEGLREPVFVVGIIRAVAGEQQLVTERVQEFFQLEGEQGEEGVLQISGDQAHGMALANSQTSRGAVADVAQAACGFLDAQAGFGAEAGIARGVIENTGGGGGMHAGFPRHVFQIRHAHPTIPCKHITQYTNHENY